MAVAVELPPAAAGGEADDAAAATAPVVGPAAGAKMTLSICCGEKWGEKAIKSIPLEHLHHPDVIHGTDLCSQTYQT